MLTRIEPNRSQPLMNLKIQDASYPVPFRSGLEYAPPARGTWNIVHTGMLIPGAHEIFVCAAGCIRGVVLTAAEMNAMDRFSTITIRENNVLDGDMEELITDGVSDILNKLDSKPSAVLIYTSCIHHFMVCDLARVYAVLREAYPEIRFTDCYMNPIMRKSGLTPDQLMRKQLYSFLTKEEQDPASVNIIGNDLVTDPSSDLIRMMESAGCHIMDITQCKTFEEYMKMSRSFLNITTYPAADAAGEELQKRLGQNHLPLPFSFDYEEIDSELKQLADALHIGMKDTASAKREADAALNQVKDALNDTPIAIDYTAFTRPLQLAKLLIEHGMHVSDVYLDAIDPAEKEAFTWLQRHARDLILHPTVHPDMRMEPRDHKDTLAIGQKAAYFTGTNRFVNIVENGGCWGYDGIVHLAAMISDAYMHPKDASKLITIKGLGAGVCCL
ncbi:MAG: nitrogenase [Erysipelotrichia bacterium]|nr:nitrogenase [Erysipelotrichia bacterium]